MRAAASSSACMGIGLATMAMEEAPICGVEVEVVGLVENCASPNATRVVETGCGDEYLPFSWLLISVGV